MATAKGRHWQLIFYFFPLGFAMGSLGLQEVGENPILNLIVLTFVQNQVNISTLY
jgi:hypothetical protein